MTSKIKILIINDDGIHAPGLRHLWEALVDVADVSIVAPAMEKSAVGMGITVREPIHIHPVAWEKGTPAWKVSGTPADCVRMSLSVLFDSPPDLIVSGINRGANSGRNILYSGTIAGVIEGVLRNIPGIAFSCVDFDKPNYKLAQPWIHPLIRHVIEHPLPKGTLLNVNFPDTPKVHGLKLARHGQGFWIEDPDHRTHPEGHSYYWHGGKWFEHEEEEESDVYLLRRGFATAVPLHIHELTDLNMLKARKEQFNQLFASPENL